MNSTYIIAEAGVNHNGKPELAFALIDAAVDAGVNAIKFQTFKAKNIVTTKANKAKYQQKATGSAESQLQMLERLELSFDFHHQLMTYCKKKKIDFLSTAFDFESLEFLHGELGLTTLKIPSGELTNAPLVLAHARTQCQLIVSTGMAVLEEVKESLAIIAYGLLNPDESDKYKLLTREIFDQAYDSEEGQKLLKEKVTLLHCTTEYPAPPNDINLKAIDTLASVFSLPVGYSDHSLGVVIPVGAVARGATLIEKHFTLDKTLDGPDHQASLEPDELKNMVEAIRVIEKAVGDGIKAPSLAELANKEAARKSLVAEKDIEKGEKYSEANLAIKRPGGGMSPINYWRLLGRVATSRVRAGDYIND